MFSWKKSWILTLISLVAFSWVFAYEPTTEADLQELSDLKTQINLAVENNNPLLFSYYQQMRELEKQFQSPAKLNYQLQHLRNFLQDKMEAKRDISKSASKSQKTQFLAQYQQTMEQYADPLHQNCYGRYHTLDTMSFAYDFPTVLTMAVWFREANCLVYRPKNGDGPFQIVSKDYGAGKLDKPAFEVTIQDFLEFARKKIDRYNSKNPTTPITLSYENLSYDDVYKFAALYNGLSGATVYGDIAPAAPKYFFEKMPGEFEKGKRNGLWLQTLRALERELNKSEDFLKQL